MTADAKIKQIALISIVLGWPTFVLVYLLVGIGPILEWSFLCLMALTIGLECRWIFDAWSGS